MSSNIDAYNFIEICGNVSTTLVRYLFFMYKMRINDKNIRKGIILPQYPSVLNN
jgi:hypothetical protein